MRKFDNIGIRMKEIEKILTATKILISDERYKDALELLKEGLEKYKDDPGILTQLSILYELLGDFKKSKEMLEKAIELCPAYSRAHYIKGIDCQNEGDLQQAEKEFQTAIENYPKYEDMFLKEHLSEVHNNLGTVYYLLGKHEKAIKEWKLAITYGRNNTEARNNLREFSNKPIDKPETGKDFEYFVDRGIELSEEGRLVESIRVLKKAYSLKPDNSLLNYNIGLVYGKIGDFENALKHLEKFLKLEPNHKESAKIRKLVRKIKRGDFKR